VLTVVQKLSQPKETNATKTANVCCQLERDNLLPMASTSVVPNTEQPSWMAQ